MKRLEDSLGVRGRELWDSLHETYEFDLHESNLVVEVCRTLDLIAELSASVAKNGVMVEGSQGQLVLNPAVAELRQQQASYARLLPLLDLDAVGASVMSPASLRASQAAKVRWAKRG